MIWPAVRKLTWGYELKWPVTLSSTSFLQDHYKSPPRHLTCSLQNSWTFSRGCSAIVSSCVSLGRLGLSWAPCPAEMKKKRSYYSVEAGNLRGQEGAKRWSRSDWEMLANTVTLEEQGAERTLFSSAPPPQRLRGRDWAPEVSGHH